jgi:hypothetical protein
MLVRHRLLAVGPTSDINCEIRKIRSADFTNRGLGVPRMATLTVTGKPGSLEICVVDDKTRNARVDPRRLHRRFRRPRL